MEAPTTMPPPPPPPPSQAQAPGTPTAPDKAANEAPVPSPESDKAKRKRQPRNSACQPCASLKMKCVASADVPGKCERCSRMGRACVPAIPKPRKRRAESGSGGDFSSGIQLSSLVESDTPASTQQLPPRPQSSYQSVGSIDSLLSRSDIRHNGSRSFQALLTQGLGIESFASGDLLQGIDYNYVQNSFTIFRQFATHFPFVSIPLGADTTSVVAQRPFMTAAVCTVTAAANPSVQDRLNTCVRLSLSAKAVVEGERTMDLLVGLLIYLAWHHHYMSKQQIYQYLCLLAGMATDLGLNRHTPPPSSEDLAQSVERDRAFLGCYYISCGLAMRGFNKPTPIRWTDNLQRCAENVARNGKLPSDRTILSTVEIVHALQDFEEGLLVDMNLRRSTFASFVDMHAKATNQRLKSLRWEHTSLGSSIGFAAAVIEVHQKMLAATDSPDTSILIQCACAIKEYLDDILARPPITLHQITIVDWTNLLEILLLTAKISKPLPNAAGWETGALTTMLQPDAILDAICNHMASAPTNDPLAPRHEPLLQWLRSFCDGIKKRIVHVRDPRESGNTLATNVPGGQHTTGLQVGFRPVNDRIPSITDLPLPYDVDPGFNYFGQHSDGVLDERFLSSFIRNG